MSLLPVTASCHPSMWACLGATLVRAEGGARQAPTSVTEMCLQGGGYPPPKTGVGGQVCHLVGAGRTAPWSPHGRKAERPASAWSCR